MIGFKVKLDKSQYTLGLMGDKGHISINILFKKTGNRIEQILYMGGVDDSIFKKWLHKSLKPNASIKIEFTEIDEISKAEEIQEMEDSGNEQLLTQFYELQEQLIKEGLI